MILTFLFWINISWALTLPGTQLRSYQASGLAARTLLLPQTRASRHSCLARPMGQLVAPGLAGLMSLTPFSALLFSCSGCPFCPMSHMQVTFLILLRCPLFPPLPTLSLSHH